MTEDTPKPKKPQTEAQKRAKAKYYQSHKEIWKAYEQSPEGKARRKRGRISKAEQAEYMREYRKRKKESQNDA
jgi:hypothetical protein